ncbi:MAG: V-type ATP synthase subunit B [Armatimonadetes bacterium]|nr:V-type ATP synthase subunit B [Armatimonadota bacterium]
MEDLLTAEYRTIEAVKGPLVFVRHARRAALGDLVTLEIPSNEIRSGQVIEASEKWTIVQLFGPSDRISPGTTWVKFAEEGAHIALSPLILGRIFSGSGEPLDSLPQVPPLERRDVHGSAINPVCRDLPTDFIQTGLSAIDGLNTLVRGQKLPIFSCPGLPAGEIAAHLISHACVPNEEGGFAVVFAAMGISSREARFYLETFESSGALEHSVIFMNLADDAVIERLLTPRFALAAAEYLAFDRNMHVLVVLCDMTHYCNALREVSSSREEIPGRRGYPGYLYTDLAGIYERAGRIKGRSGSVTQIPILTMPDDDITHPVPDLTGYITEGQIVLDRRLHRKGIFPPIQVLPSLSRLMDRGIGEGRTREDHRPLADQLYACYARGTDQRRVASIIGEEALNETDRMFLRFAEDFERGFVGQGVESRSISKTLDLGWRLLAALPEAELVRVSKDLIRRYGAGGEEHGWTENQQT